MTQQQLASFYHQNPLPFLWENEKFLLEDFEYLQELYSYEVKKYQKRIASLIEPLDYLGSLIYDDVPDQVQLTRLAKNITAQLRREEQTDACLWDCSDQDEDKWKWIFFLVQILLYCEIFKRRHKKGRRTTLFLN